MFLHFLRNDDNAHTSGHNMTAGISLYLSEPSLSPFALRELTA